MRRATLLSFCLLGWIGTAHTQAGDESPPVITAFVDVTVIPMTSNVKLGGYTVVVRDGIIVEVGPTHSVDVPPGAFRVDGRGRYLLPGLIDAHVHLRRATDLDLLLVNGVTTVRVMSGSPRSLLLRRQIAEGSRLGPTIYTAGPILEGIPPPEFEDVIPTGGKVLIASAEEAFAEVSRQAAARYDYVKVYNNLSAEIYAAVTEAAGQFGLPVVGHVPVEVGVSGALESGQRTIEHLTGYSAAILTDGRESPGPDYRTRELAWLEADRLKMMDVAAAAAQAGVYNAPTLMIHVYGAPQDYLDAFMARPWAVYMDPVLHRSLERREQMRWLSFGPDDFESTDSTFLSKQELLRAFRDAGAKIVAGSDLSPLGFTLHAELLNLMAAGLTQFETLEAATTSAAEALAGPAADFGTIEVGKRADLLLVDGDPLQDIRHASRISGVMARGIWIADADLDATLAAIRETLGVREELDGGVSLARRGDIVGAREVFESAGVLSEGRGDKTDLDRRRAAWMAGHLATLCRLGALWGHAEDVLPTCNRAIDHEPEDGLARESRGLARASAGDLEGAEEDIEAALDNSSFPDNRSRREAWLQELRSGKNPFTHEILLTLREEDCNRLVPSLIECG